MKKLLGEISVWKYIFRFLSSFVNKNLTGNIENINILHASYLQILIKPEVHSTHLPLLPLLEIVEEVRRSENS